MNDQEYATNYLYRKSYTHRWTDFIDDAIDEQLAMRELLEQQRRNQNEAARSR